MLTGCNVINFLFMKKLHGSYLLIFFLLHLNGLHSFSQQAVFTQVPPPAGGWASPIFSITQDAKGYMWFASNGEHRYDGYSYKSYFNDPQDSSSLVFNRTEAIFADSKGFIWVGTNRKGLDRLDPATGIFTHFRYSPSNKNTISNDSISAVMEDRDGKIWVGTEVGGLNCIDPASGKITRFRHDPNDTNSLSCNNVTALYEDRQGVIWVGTGILWADTAVKVGGLNRFNRANKNFTRFMHNPYDPFSLIDNRVRAIFEDSKGRFWVGTKGDGLHTMNREKGTFDRHRYNAADKNALSRPPPKKISWPGDMISFIREDAVGAIWIGTASAGLNRYNPATRKTSYYASLDEQSIAKNEVPVFWASYPSKDGVFWITGMGAYHMDPIHKQIPHYDVGTPVSSLLQDGKGKLWIGTGQGVLLLDSARMIKKFFINKTSDTTSLSGNKVNSILEDRSGTIWVGTDKGLNRYNNQSQKFTHYLDKHRIGVIYEDRQGLLWLGTNKGLVSMNKRGDTFEYFQHNKTDTTSLSHNSITSIRENRAGYLWIGTGEGGLNRFDKNNKTFQHYLSTSWSIKIFEDKDGVLWIGTSSGLYYLKPSGDRFVLFTNEGLGLTRNMSISQILEDDQQSLWINTGLGLFRLKHNRTEVSFFGKKHGFIMPSWTTQNSSFKGKGGELFFGDNLGNGYYAFFPGQIKENSIPPNVNITAFRIGNQLVDSFKDTKEIRLPYNQNVFSFEFAGIHYSSPEDNQHMFMLENLDNDWRKAGDDKTAYYYNVSPGKYVFRVKAANSDGVWAEKSISVIISPPWWRTWWAYTLYGLLLLAVVYTVHRYQRQRLIRSERERARAKELEQAKEIEKAYTDLKSTQSQLIQSEKMASLGEITAGIAHEIQNPLNFINNFSDVNKELLNELKQENDKGNTVEVKAIADNLMDNEDKINHHGKRADSIVKGMLQHSRASTGKKESTNINALADEYLRLSYQGFRAKDKDFKADFKTSFDESIGKIQAVPQDIGRVLLNLYNNAFYACTERSRSAAPLPPPENIWINSGGFKDPNYKHEPTVWVRTSRNPLSGGRGAVLISVKDNGPGIPQNIVDKIFQPFFTTKPTGQGTGLGLSLSYDIIKAHGGEIKVDTKEGEGTKFTIILSEL